MPPKKKDVKQERGEQKALEKQKQKIVEDKTFGLKNKNKSKVVQKFIKGMQNTAKGPTKGGESDALRKSHEEKEEKKKKAQQDLLLASLFKGSDAAKKAAADFEQQKAYDPKTSREDQKINLYIDQRIQKAESMKKEDQEKIYAWMKNESKTEIVCKFFLQAVEKMQYGWFWNCPNGGDSCIYKHCLPPGYVLKEQKNTDDQPEDTRTLEEILESERQSLTTDGTPVTLETFTEWKKRKEEERKRKVEDQRKLEAQRTGTKGFSVLSGRDLFTYDPSLFVDDEGAASEEDYEEDEDEIQNTILENQRILNKANKIPDDTGITSVHNDKRLDTEEDTFEKTKPINKNLFLEDELPDDLDMLDE